MTVKKGSKITIEYTGTFDDGTVFDSSEKHGKPLEFEAGSGKVIPGFDAAVIGMKKGEEKEITIEPNKAYGDHNPALLKNIPIEQLPKEPKPETGMILGIKTPDGKQIPAMILEVKDKEIVIDLNHPLAGKTLHFKIKVLEIN